MSYYGLLLIATLLGVGYGYYFSEVFFPTARTDWVETVLNLLKLFWLVPVPYALLNYYSFVRYPVVMRPPAPAPAPLPDTRLYFRFVTRGQNPKLVAQTVKSARKVLSLALADNAWRIEVVTDNALTLASKNTRVIIVPGEYETERHTRYKGRALHYALDVSDACDHDWVIHLDEETYFGRETALHIHHFVAQQQAFMSENADHPKIGQGVILYGKREITNWITTLADSLRVGDDYGRFRLQYEHGKAYFGIHGSFIVINVGFERKVGFDYGPVSSITEDAYFALVAQAAGATFAFINAHMYEQSPFSIKDFMRQRRRWFGGLWLSALSPVIPLKERAVLITFMLMWSSSWLSLAMVYINLIYPTGTSVWISICGGLSFLYYVTLYLIGFFCTYNRQTYGSKFYLLLAAQIIGIPLFSVMESCGVLYALFSPPKDFHIVQKEAG